MGRSEEEVSEPQSQPPGSDPVCTSTSESVTGQPDSISVCSAPDIAALGDSKEASLPQSEEASTVANSLGDTSSEPGDAETRSLSTEVDAWNSMRYRSQMQACRAYAHHPDDVFLLDSFLSLAELPDIDEDSVKLLLRSLKLLRLCDYSVEDLCCILAHASAYFLDAFGLCGVNMDTSEVGNVLVSLVFVAHCYVQDETCPLHVWHQHLFRKYCPLRTLNSAIIRLLEIRQYVLRLSSQELNRRYATLFKACNQNLEVEDTTSHERNEALAHRLREDATK